MIPTPGEPPEPEVDDPGISKERRDYQHGEPDGESFIVVNKDGTTLVVLNGEAMAGKVDLSGLKLLGGMPTALEAAVLGACREYANRGYRGEPIVRRHFTAGNRSRYEWAPLSERYAAWKEGVTPAKKAAMVKARRIVPKGKGLPMLVLSGAMRDAITSGRARVVRVGPGRFVIRWANDPPYTIYHHTGTPKMPKRSPVEPNAEDMQAIWAAANRYLSGFIAAGGAVPVGGAPGGKARVA